MLFRCDCEYELSFFPPWPKICSGGQPSLDNSSPCVLENNRDISDEGDTADEDKDDRLLIMWMVMMKHTSSLGENGKVRGLRLQKTLKTVYLVVLRKRRSKNCFTITISMIPSCHQIHYHHHPSPPGPVDVVLVLRS